MSASGDPPGGEPFRCGVVCVVGRPNVGKSTLVNRLLGRKVSITSRKPQTTRHRILGIKSDDRAQVIYVDTPGIHLDRRRALNRYMNRTADQALVGVDLALMMVEAPRWVAEDQVVADKVAASGTPAILVVNKVDRVADKRTLLPYLQEAATHAAFVEVVPVSARRGTNVERLAGLVVERLPPGEALYPCDQITDRGERFRVAEIVREKLIRRLGDELPHQLTVEVERFDADGPVVHIGAVVWVEKRTQKVIVVGHRGDVMKAVGSAARREIEELLARRVHLELWVKVRSRWSDDERVLHRLGYGE